MKHHLLPSALLLALCLPLLVGQAPEKDKKDKAKTAEATKEDQKEIDEALAGIKKKMELANAIQWKTGKVDLKDGLATLEVPKNWKFAGPSDARVVLTDLWGNPPSEALGILFPEAMSPMEGNSWGVILQYEEDGYVKDDEAKDLNYSDLLKEMQESTKEGSEERVKEGYESVELLSWAEPPHYDSASNKLYWAKTLRFGGEKETTLNYDIRALGRKGVLVMQAVANSEQLPVVQAGMKEVLGFVTFNPGNRYSDFNPSLDKVATYGIGALVAGKLASKVGLLAKLIAVLAGSKKLLAFLIVPAGALIKKLFGKKEEPVEMAEATQTETAGTETEPPKG